LILVCQYDSPYVRRVAVSLHLLGIPFARYTISGFADAEEMRKINPLGRIPSLILDDGEVIIDSAAILDHVDSIVGPARALLPPGGRARRRALFVASLATGVLDKAGQIVYERALRPPDKIHEPWLARCRVQVDSGLAAIEALTGDDWTLATPGPMLPDITVGCIVLYLRARLPEVLAHPKLAAFADRCAALDAFRATEWSDAEVMPSGV
jgi:glutathione S-transferase